MLQKKLLILALLAVSSTHLVAQTATPNRASHASEPAASLDSTATPVAPLSDSTTTTEANTQSLADSDPSSTSKAATRSGFRSKEKAVSRGPGFLGPPRYRPVISR